LSVVLNCVQKMAYIKHQKYLERLYRMIYDIYGQILYFRVSDWISSQ